MAAWRKAAISLAILATVVVSVVIATGGTTDPSNLGSVSPRQASSPADSVSREPVPTHDPTAFVGPEFDEELIREPTAHKPQSKLWVHDGRWWSVMPSAAGEYTIHWLEWGSQAWQDTGVLVDHRIGTYSDVVADGDRVYVATAGGTRASSEPGDQQLPDSERALVRRFTYDAAAARYVLDPGFPVRLTEVGVSGITIDLDAEKNPWAAFLLAGRTWVTTTDGADQRWVEPFPLPSEGNEAGVTQATIVSRDSEVGVLWSNESEDALYFATHDEGAPVDAWSTSRIIVEGYENADDHINVKTLDGPQGGIYAVIKTSLDDIRPRLPDRELILLLARDGEGGDWRKIVVGRVRDDHSRPILLIDESARELYVFATAPGRFGDVYFKRAPLDDLRFASGRGQLFASAPGHAISSPTSTKQPVSDATGIVVLATDTSTNRVIHGAMGLGSVRVAEGQELPGAGVTPAGPSEPTVVFHHTFDGYLPGDTPPLPWELTREPRGEMTIVPGLQDTAARIHSASGSAVRACHDAPVGANAFLEISVRFQAERLGSNDAYLLSVRGPQSELASLRLLPDGELAQLDGEEKRRTGTVLATGVWYGATMALDLQARSYSWSITEVLSGGQVASGSGAAIPPAADAVPDRVCFLSSDGSDDLGLVIDDVRVLRRPSG